MTRQHLERAKMVLARARWIGLQETMRTSIIMLRRTFGFPDRNQTTKGFPFERSHKKDGGTGRALARSQLQQRIYDSAALQAQLLANHALDLELYAFGVLLFCS